MLNRTPSTFWLLSDLLHDWYSLLIYFLTFRILVFSPKVNFHHYTRTNVRLKSSKEWTSYWLLTNIQWKLRHSLISELVITPRHGQKDSDNKVRSAFLFLNTSIHVHKKLLYLLFYTALPPTSVLRVKLIKQPSSATLHCFPPLNKVYKSPSLSKSKQNSSQNSKKMCI